MSQETLEFLLLVLGVLYVSTVLVAYLFYQIKWKKLISSRQSEFDLAKKQALSGQLAEEHARNLVKSMRKTIETYEQAICKEDSNKPVDK